MQNLRYSLLLTWTSFIIHSWACVCVRLSEGTCMYTTNGCLYIYVYAYCMHASSPWRHNWHDGVSNHQPHDCLLNRLFKHKSKKTSKLRVTGLCVGNSPVTGEFPAQMASNEENVSIWWRHHDVCFAARAHCIDISVHTNLTTDIENVPLWLNAEMTPDHRPFLCRQRVPSPQRRFYRNYSGLNSWKKQENIN